MGWVKIKEAEYGTKLYELLWKLQGTDYFLAYSDLFPNRINASPENPEDYQLFRDHYKILRDTKSRELLRLLHQGQKNGKMGIDDVATRLSLEADEVRSRIEFFRKSGMRSDVSLR